MNTATINEHLKRALTQHQQGDLAGAERLYRDIVLIDPHQADALHLLGVVQHQKHRYDEALDYVGQAIKSRSNIGSYHNTLGAVYAAKGCYEEAVLAFENAAALEPKSADAHLNLGVVHLEAGAYTKALPCLETALELNTDLGTAWRNAGRIFAKAQQYAQAVGCFQQAIKRQPQLHDTYFHLAGALHKMGRLDEAAACYRAARQVSEQYGQLRRNPYGMLDALAELGEAAASLCNGASAAAAAAAASIGQPEPGAAVAARTDLRIHAPAGDDRTGSTASCEADAAGAIKKALDVHRRIAPAAARYIRASEAYAHAEGVLEHLLAAYRNTPLLTDPFEHFYIDGLFPEDFYQAILDHLPATEQYAELMHPDAILPNGHSARLQFPLTEENIRKLPEPARTFWLDYTWIFESDELKFANFGKYGKHIRASANPILFRDIAGYKILPHPDIPEKKVTTQFYLPRDNGRTHLGTCLYVEKGKDARGVIRFEKVKQFPFRSNSGYSFLVSPDSWHGVEETDIGDGPRDTLMIIHLVMGRNGY